VHFTSFFYAVNKKRDVLRCPPDIILMPVVRWIKVLELFRFVGEARPDEIGSDFIEIMRF